MMARRAGWFILLPLSILLLTGCQQTQISAPAPDFQPPTFRPTPGFIPGPPKVGQTPVTPRGPGGSGQKPLPTLPTGVFDANGFGLVAGDPLVTGVPISSRAKEKNKQWKYIIVHHSDTNAGCAHRFDLAHRARGWEMLGYDFVIGNGTESRDGAIEIGPRWAYQLQGAHTGTPDHVYNDWGIGICLVGNFAENRPTRAQMESLAKLCAYFMKTYHIPASRILGHRDCKSTDCPGTYMYTSLPQLRQMATAYAKSAR